VIGKTEGNGGVNDFTRSLADQAFRRVLLKHGTRTEAEIHNVPMVWSGGCDGVITPHATIFARNGKTGPADKSRLVIGTALSAELLPEDIGRPAMVQKVADAVKAAMKDAGITDPRDVHYVQTKTPLLTIDSVRDAETRHQTLACEVHDSMGVSNGTTALGIAVALGEVPMPKAEQICKDLDLYSSVASCSSGVELTQAQIVLLGNKAGAGGRYRIGHSVMRDALDIDGIYDSIRDAVFTVSPMAVYSATCCEPTSPTTTGPVLIPTRTAKSRPYWLLICAAKGLMSFWISSAANTARSGSSSCAAGAPKNARNASPIRRATVPS